MSAKANTCCDLCNSGGEVLSVSGGSGEFNTVCSNPSCECHTKKCEKCGRTSNVVNLSNCPFCTPNTESKWEDRFEGRFDIFNTENEQGETTIFLRTSPKEIKSFIAEEKVLSFQEGRVSVIAEVKKSNFYKKGREDALEEAALAVEKMVGMNDGENWILEKAYQIIRSLKSSS